MHVPVPAGRAGRMWQEGEGANLRTAVKSRSLMAMFEAAGIGKKLLIRQTLPSQRQCRRQGRGTAEVCCACQSTVPWPNMRADMSSSSLTGVASLVLVFPALDNAFVLSI